jgi:ATP-dependent Clp protease ATP-binding subunit ClpA
LNWNIASFQTGTKYVGQTEEKLQKCLDVFKSNPGNYTFVDEVHTIIGVGTHSHNSKGIEEHLKPHLTSGDLRMIGATTPEEYQKHIATNKAFVRRLHPIEIPEPNTEQTIAILEGTKIKYEEHHGITIPKAAIHIITEQCKANKKLFSPAKEIAMLDRLCTRQRLNFENKHGEPSTKETLTLSV